MLLIVSFFSYMSEFLLHHFRGSLRDDVAFSLATRCVLEYSFVAHVPLLMMVLLTITVLFRPSQRAWAVGLMVCFASFAVVATIWIVGFSSPFLVIPHPQ